MRPQRPQPNASRTSPRQSPASRQTSSRESARQEVKSSKAKSSASQFKTGVGDRFGAYMAHHRISAIDSLIVSCVRRRRAC